jgi:hypothetical protein
VVLAINWPATSQPHSPGRITRAPHLAGPSVAKREVWRASRLHRASNSDPTRHTSRRPELPHAKCGAPASQPGDETCTLHKRAGLTPSVPSWLVGSRADRRPPVIKAKSWMICLQYSGSSCCIPPRILRTGQVRPRGGELAGVRARRSIKDRLPYGNAGPARPLSLSMQVQARTRTDLVPAAEPGREV